MILYTKTYKLSTLNNTIIFNVYIYNKSLITKDSLKMHFPQPQRKVQKHDVYFQGNKKNQLNQLKGFFKTALTDPQQQHFVKQVVKKIIVYTTQGIDTSRFYPQMVIASATKDLTIKKLISVYLNLYSHHNPDFSRMAINTFTKDILSPNPIIRALAIRHLSNLRFKGRQQYMMPYFKQGLTDLSANVKQACVMGITKLIVQQNRRVEEPVRDQELLDGLYGMLRDDNAKVVCTVIEAINQIQPEGIAISKKLAHYLVKNMEKFNQMQLATVLRYLELYDPKQQQEIMEFLNKLDPKIKSQNLSLVLAISKIYLKYGNIHPTLLPQIHSKIKPSLLSFLNSSTSQIEYIALKQILYLIKKYCLTQYRKDIKKFYLKQDDPSYNKFCKIQLMQINCYKQNFGDVVNQFTEYIRDVNIVQQVMQALSRLILKLQLNQSKIIIKTLNDIIVNTTGSKQYICNAAIRTVRTFLRKYPQQFKMFQHTFYIYVRGVTTVNARCAMVEIIGDYGEEIEDAVQLVVLGQANIQDSLKISLLRANLKLFFKRPMEMMNIITNLFKQILTDQQTRLPVKDYAAMLYRGLQNDIQSFKKIFLSCRQFAEQIILPCKILQTNTFQVPYMRNCEQWLLNKTKYIELIEQIQYQQPQPGQNDNINVQNNNNYNNMTQQQRINLNRSTVNLNSSYSKITPQMIDKQYQITAQQFQKYWQQYQIGSSITRIIKQIQLLNQQTLQQLCALWGVYTIASMESQDSIKIYLYFKLDIGDIICMELTIMKEVQTMALMVKCQNQELGGFAAKYVQDFFRINQIL